MVNFEHLLRHVCSCSKFFWKLFISFSHSYYFLYSNTFLLVTVLTSFSWSFSRSLSLSLSFSFLDGGEASVPDFRTSFTFGLSYHKDERNVSGSIQFFTTLTSILSYNSSYKLLWYADSLMPNFHNAFLPGWKILCFEYVIYFFLFVSSTAESKSCFYCRYDVFINKWGGLGRGLGGVRGRDGRKAVSNKTTGIGTVACLWRQTYE